MTKYIEEHNFNFDNVYGENSTTEEVYLQTVRPMIEAAFKDKAKVTCFAYGQTGSGKTHTMMGPTNTNGQVITPGLYLLSGFDLFNFISTPEYQHLKVHISFYEIYCGKLHDLLNDRNVLSAREDGKGNICINGLQEKNISNLNELMKTIDTGLKCRTVGVTGANADSSRSHAIIQISLKSGNGNTHGKISFIDLAGSERAQDTVDTNKQTRFDGAEINKSLLALKECIRALDQSKSHTPFRGSKLTLVLRDSFVGGNCKTLMIANVSPSQISAENTLNTLRYADRVKELKKDKSESFSNVKKDNFSDLKEDLAKIMMMPRNHNATVKYTLDGKILNDAPLNKSLNQNFNNRVNNENINNNNNNNTNNNSSDRMNAHLNNIFASKLNPMLNQNNSNNNNQNNNQYNNTNSNSSNNNNQIQNGVNTKNDNLLKRQEMMHTQIRNNNTTVNNYNNSFNQLTKLNENHVKEGYVIVDNNNNRIKTQTLKIEDKSKQNSFPNVEILVKDTKETIMQQQYQKENRRETTISNYTQKNTNNNRETLNLNQKPRNNNPDTLDFINNFNYYKNGNQENFNSTNNANNANSVNIINQQIEKLSNEHEILIQQILEEEDKVVLSHRNHMDIVVESIKRQMFLLNNVEKSGSDIGEYIKDSEKELKDQINNIQKLLSCFANFNSMVNKEAEITQKIITLSSGLSNNNNNNANNTIFRGDNQKLSTFSLNTDSNDVLFNSFANNTILSEENNNAKINNFSSQTNNQNQNNNQNKYNNTQLENNYSNHKNLNEYRYLNSQKKQENVNTNFNNKNEDCDKVLIDEFLHSSKNKDFFNESSYSKMDNVEYFTQEQEESQYQQKVQESEFMNINAIGTEKKFKKSN